MLKMDFMTKRLVVRLGTLLAGWLVVEQAFNLNVLSQIAYQKVGPISAAMVFAALTGVYVIGNWRYSKWG